MELQQKMQNNREDVVEQSRFEYSHFESLYKLLFKSVGVSICICKMIFDTNGCPQNYFFLDVNQGLIKATGIKREYFLGKTIRDLFPNIDDKSLDNFGKVVKSGIPHCFENYYPELDKHFEVIGVSLGNGKFAAIFVDITDQKIVERKLVPAYICRCPERRNEY
ncbi:MAG: PAS domain-containing protein [Bacillota bacterium]